MSVIEVFADVRCPFTHVGLRRFRERRAASGRDDIVLRVRAWPLELVNAAPLDAALIAEEVDELHEQVAPELFAGFDASRFPESSMPALALAASAYAHGDAAGESVSLALRDALFEQGLDVAAAGVLAAIAAEVGIEVPPPGRYDAVLADWEEGRRRGVIGSPHFFVGGGGFFCPSLDIERVEGSLRIAFDRPAFDAFLERCLVS